MTLVLLLSSKYVSTNSEQSCYVNYSLVTLLLQAVASSIQLISMLVKHCLSNGASYFMNSFMKWDMTCAYLRNPL